MALLYNPQKEGKGISKNQKRGFFDCLSILFTKFKDIILSNIIFCLYRCIALDNLLFVYLNL